MADKTYLPSAKLLNLPFDQFSRQYLAKKLIELNRTKKSLKILDIGGYKGKTADFFPQDTVTIVDLFDVKEPNYVKGSALDLPFPDDSFDFLVSFDVFEHIAEADRTRFLQEAFRVSSDGVLLAAPFNTSNVAMAEKELNAYYRRQNGVDHQWLIEHIDNGLPKLAPTTRFFADNCTHHAAIRSNPLWLWCMMQDLIFLADSCGSPELITDVNTFYNRHVDELDAYGEESYRQMLFGRHAQAITTPPESQSGKAVGAIRELVNSTFVSVLRLVAHNNQARAQAGLIAKKDGQIAELQATLQSIYSSDGWKMLTRLRRVKRGLRR